MSSERAPPSSGAGDDVLKDGNGPKILIEKSQEQVCRELEESRRLASTLKDNVEKLEALIAGKDAEIKSMADYLESERERHGEELNVVLTERDKYVEDLEYQKEVFTAKIKGLEQELTVSYLSSQTDWTRLKFRSKPNSFFRTPFMSFLLALQTNVCIGVQ